MKYFLITLGCQMNHSDSERICTVIESMGYERTLVEEEANLIGVVACSVRQKAIDKVYSKIYKWNKWKNSRNLITFVSGCILPADEEKFLKLFDLVFRTPELPNLPEMVRQSGVITHVAVNAMGSGTDDIAGHWQVDPTYTSEIEAFVPIQNGCDKFCSFCAVPYTRGREVSRPSSEILAEVEKLVVEGRKSITLLGQNVNSYGLDKQGEEVSFAELLRLVGELGRRLDREFWLYFTSPHPRDMTRDVLEVIAEYPCLAKQIHLPLQSGDEKVLIRMNRNHSVDRYRNIVSNIRELLPTATLFTDIIVGFSGETEEQFENTAKLMRECEFNMAFVAKYSPRPGARAARWEDDVSPDEKSRRLAVLNEILTTSSRAKNEAMVGKTVRVLVEREDRRMKGALSCRTEGKLIVRAVDASSELIGTFQNVRITEAGKMSMTGEVI